MMIQVSYEQHQEFQTEKWGSKVDKILRRAITSLEKFWREIVRYPEPVSAFVKGICLAGGMGLNAYLQRKSV